MENTLEIGRNKKYMWPAFIAWIKQTGRPFLARWWIWIVLVISPTYLTYYFNQSSLENRIGQTISNLNSDKKGIAKAGEHANDTVSKAGYVIGYIVGVVAKGWRVFLMTILLFIALLDLQYQFVFQPLFERDVPGRWIYIVLVVMTWLAMATLFAKAVGPSGVQSGLQWTLANGIILLMLIYSLFISWRNAARRQLILTQQRTQAELDALKAQVDPHFLFNSLNNIYGTAILEDSPRTAESIQQLSGIVRYVMEESRVQTTDIQRELRFIDDFVELQRIRLPDQDNIDIKIGIEWDEKPAQIVPLLLNPLIENAFKYGISMQHPCFVHIQLSVQQGTLQLTTENSVLARTGLEKGTGLGLANVRQRLTLAYPEQHTLIVKEENNTFLVDLTIKL